MSNLKLKELEIKKTYIQMCFSSGKFWFGRSDVSRLYVHVAVIF